VRDNVFCGTGLRLFLGDAMIFGVSLAFLLLPGVPVATAMPPDGYLAEYEIPMPEELYLEAGYGRRKLKNCKLVPVDAKKNLWVVKYDVLGTSRKTKEMSRQDAEAWKTRNC
jgi:hypothetical protein